MEYYAAIKKSKIILWILYEMISEYVQLKRPGI